MSCSGGREKGRGGTIEYGLRDDVRRLLRDEFGTRGRRRVGVRALWRTSDDLKSGREEWIRGDRRCRFGDV